MTIRIPSWNGESFVGVPGRREYRMGTTMIRWPFLTASTDISVSISKPVSFRFIWWIASFVNAR